MNKNNPIGIFDSGIGGLTVMAEIMRLLPHENIIYFGDTAHVPYGSKSPETVIRYSKNISKFLASKKAKLIVIACNTASAFSLDELKKTLKIPVIGVIEPGAKTALEVTRNSRIGVIGTEGTIKSSSYTKAILGRGASARVFSKACPLFVPLVEEGWLDHKVTRSVAGEYLSELIKNKIDTLVLGCTHYPLIKAAISSVMGKTTKLIDSAEATAREVCDILDGLNLAKTNGKSAASFYVSDAPEKFKRSGEKFLGKKISKVTKIDIEEGGFKCI